MLLYTQKNLQEFMGACFKIHIVQFTTVVLVLLKETLLILTKKKLDWSSAGKPRLHRINQQDYTGSPFLNIH